MLEPLTSAEIEREVQAAALRLRPYIRVTPLIGSHWRTSEGEKPVHLKLENLQLTGSFKVRGALNKVLCLPGIEQTREVIAASTGNHGAAVAFAASVTNANCTVFVPVGASEVKLRRIRRYGARIQQVGTDALEAEVEARAHAKQHGFSYVSPYNDPDVVIGQATLGLELISQCDRPPEAIFLPLGGGGLSAGVASVVKSAWPNTRIFGCSPAHSSVMIQSIEAGRILKLPSLPTFSDGTAGGIESGSVTFELCRSLLDELVTVTEHEIAESLLYLIENESILVEGSAAVPVAAYRKVADNYPSPSTVLMVLSGGNISAATLSDVLSGRPPD